MSAHTDDQDQSPSTEEAPTPVVGEFDLVAHGRRAVLEYEPFQAEYGACADAVKDLLAKALAAEGIRPESIKARSKGADSFGKKAAKPSDEDSTVPKYPSPLKDITDLAGVRVVVFLLDEVEQVNRVIEREFRVVERLILGGLFDQSARGGYQSVHFLVSFPAHREDLIELRPYKGWVTEVQVRTLLQHAWAETEHDIEYKAESAITESTRRRFLSLAGVIELADREFQGISDEAAEAARPAEPPTATATSEAR
jgi:ppGpp synthetase/RelA/SpoT-type nucleotidyltranferase